MGHTLPYMYVANPDCFQGILKAFPREIRYNPLFIVAENVDPLSAGIASEWRTVSPPTDSGSGTCTLCQLFRCVCDYKFLDADCDKHWRYGNGTCRVDSLLGYEVVLKSFFIQCDRNTDEGSGILMPMNVVISTVWLLAVLWNVLNACTRAHTWPAKRVNNRAVLSTVVSRSSSSISDMG